MFGELLESRARRARNRAGVVASLVGHGAFIALAVLATRSPLTARVSEDERIVPLPLLPPDPTPSIPTGARSQRTSDPTPDAPLIPGPITPIIDHDVRMPDLGPIDPLSPAVDMTWAPSLDRSRRTATGSPGVAQGDGIPFGAGVEKPAMALGSNPAPVYPEILRRTGTRGEVTVEVVVDTTGLAQMETLRVIASDHPLLTDAVTAALKRARFLPAETGGRKVRMWVRQSFLFEVR